MDARLKQEDVSPSSGKDIVSDKHPASLIELSDSSSESDDEGPSKKRKLGVVVPEGFLQPLPPLRQLPPSSPPPPPAVPDSASPPPPLQQLSQAGPTKQFWKAGDYEGRPGGGWDSYSGGIDHVRVHPKFLHSNATSHKWALGAFAELLDNALDEVSSGATYVKIDMLKNKKDGNRMLLIEDNGGGMDPDKVRQCMSLGYSAKSKLANTIGQYGNGFKTSTMRLGADVIVFSRCPGKDGKRFTQSIGLLSYTFLRSTGKEDIVVPMLDYERREGSWNKLIRSSFGDWKRNLETVIQWSPFSSEEDLIQQFCLMGERGTRIIIYNLWEDDQGFLELDFDADPYDIQLRGVNRDEKNIQMAKTFPNSRHFLTYRHSLRSYASILYLRIPPRFRMILRGKDIEHHNIVNDMMLSQEVTYRPQPGADGVYKDTMTAVVTIGFVKDAKHHIDVQGFNVYHKNRLIKPFWRLWNPAGSGGRGVIGVLEANFVEPAHDKQGFERTTVLARLEGKLIQMQKNYWKTNSHRIGYASVGNKKLLTESAEGDDSLDSEPQTSAKSGRHSASSSKPTVRSSGKFSLRSNDARRASLGGKTRMSTRFESGRTLNLRESSSSPSTEAVNGDDMSRHQPDSNGGNHKSSVMDGVQTSTLACLGEDADLNYDSGGKTNGLSTATPLQVVDIEQLREENRQLRERLAHPDGEILSKLQGDLQTEKERCRTLERQLQEAQQKIDQMNREQETLIDIFQQEKELREAAERNLRKKLKDASTTIQHLLDKVKLLENMESPNGKSES
ncbi:protein MICRORCHIDIA 7-like isoform X2 [Rhodamnia argentea]|uniref:Protein MICRORCHIDIA 7-like isoform X2 n=1 Tax=Rhodamnia argentea TaxID=178133 RepID=A0A8B8Q742_9MYRT|nr:protein MICRORCHIDIA 7-like isoform X2 [Rhodamnia argentea]